MPELAEVEFYRRVWALGTGEIVNGVAFHPRARVFRDMNPDWLPRLTGAALSCAKSHGKQMLFGFGSAGWLGVHLGMSGQLLVADPDHFPEKHDHLVLRQAERSLVFRDPRMFGRIRFDPVTGSDPPNWWCDLPPEILSRAFSKERLEDVLRRCTRTPLKPFLLDQSIFPGIGNWMADEILWRGRFHPATLPARLPNDGPGRLWKVTREVTRDALRVIAPDWGEAPDHWLFNHRWKDGGFCPRPACQHPLIRADLRGRTTCWCPNCQIPASL